MTTKTGERALQIAREIAVLNRMNTDLADYEVIKRHIDLLAEGIGIESIDVSSTELLFRARIRTPSKPANISDIAAPPAAAVTGFQRCNSPGNPMFYAASTRNTALKECNAQPGDFFYLSEWMPKVTFEAITVFSSGLASLSSARGGGDSVVYAYLDTLFTRRIHSVFSNDYKLTAAFCELIRKRVEKLNADGSTSHHYLSLRYPSVAAIETGAYNTVMHPDNATELLTLNHVMEGQIVAEKDGKYDIVVLDNAVDFCGDVIRWTGDRRMVPELKKGKGTKSASVSFIKRTNAQGNAALFRLTLSVDHDESYLRSFLDD